MRAEPCVCLRPADQTPLYVGQNSGSGNDQRNGIACLHLSAHTHPTTSNPSHQHTLTHRLVAAYASPTSTAIVFVDSGPDPGLPALRARLDAPAKENGAAFAYAEVAGHGLVVLRIGDGVG